MKGALVALFALLAMSPAALAQHELTLTLRLNNTDGYVYVPGEGETPSGSLGPGQAYSPESLFIASYASGLLAAMAGADGTEVYAGSGSGWHEIGFTQDAGKPVLLAFTKGGWESIGARMDMIEAGEFLKHVSPSFSFGLGQYHMLKVALSYSGIDIEGGLSMSKGFFKLVIENMGVGGGKPLVNIRNA